MCSPPRRWSPPRFPMRQAGRWRCTARPRLSVRVTVARFPAATVFRYASRCTAGAAASNAPRSAVARSAGGFPTLYRLMVWKWNQETVYIRFPLLSVVCVGRSQKKGIAKTLYPLFSITIELTNCFLSITNDKTVCLFVFLEEVFFPLSSGT